MTTAVISPDISSRRRSVYADLAFWTAAGAVVAALSQPLGDRWGVPRAVLLDTGLVFAILGPVLLLGVSRIPPTRGLLAAFAVANVMLAPLALAAAEFGWLPLRAAGQWALAGAGVVMLVLGAWQLTALRRR